MSGMFVIKIVIIGDPGFDKMSLVRRFIPEFIAKEYYPTINVDVLRKNMKNGDQSLVFHI